jgi:uncharacterized protein (DUF1800 family)
MDRRAFLKLAVVTSGLTVAGVYGSDFMQMANASVNSVNLQSIRNPADSMDSDWQIPHLLRRAGFGASPDELSFYQNLGVSGALDHLLNYESIDDSNLAAQPDITMELEKKPAPGEVNNLVWWWVNRMINTPRPLEEKMALFWHNHFATVIYKVRSPFLMFKQNELLRSKGMGKFRDLLMGVSEDPAMLIWLDGARNRKGIANENYGREVMEVFTIGVGNYTEDDVKAAARAFTGYQIDKAGNSYFNPKLHDNGTKSFMGQTGNLGLEDVVTILASHPATARNISRELFTFLAYDEPSSEVLDNLQNVYLSTDGNIKAVVGAILKFDEFWSENAHLNLVKGPVDFVASALRSLGATVSPNSVVYTLRVMGQLPFNPPSVFGWPSGPAWISTSTMLDRYNFPLLIDPTKANSLQNLQTVDDVSQVLFPEGLPSDVLQTIQQSTDSLVNPSEKLRSIIRLTMASPFYNLN